MVIVIENILYLNRKYIFDVIHYNLISTIIYIVVS